MFRSTRLRNRSSSARPKARTRLWLNALERRDAPAVVTSTADFGAGSLRDAIAAAVPNETITFNLTLPATITLGSEIPVGVNVIIDGPGSATDLVINGGGVGRIFNATESFTVRDLTITNGNSTEGGAINLANAKTFTADNVRITNNFSPDVGGAIAVGTGGIVSIKNSTISGNTAQGFDGGAMYFYNGGSLTIENSTLSGNRARRGGAIYFFGTIGAFNVNQSTISGNSATVAGGAVELRSLVGNANFRQTTITQNSAPAAGGIRIGSGSGSVTLNSTIVSGNTGGTSNELGGTTGSIIAINSLTNNAGFTGTFTNSGGTSIISSTPNLGPLQNNGGTTFTHVPNAGSPALDKGANPLGLSVDQRGAPRISGATFDIGAVELQVGVPTAAFTGPNVNASGGTKYTFTVTYTDATAINTGSLDSNDIRVTNTKGFNQLATFTGMFTGVTSPIVATYEFTPPGGSWNEADNGPYTVSMEANQVTNTGMVAVAAGAIGNFSVGIPINVVVDTIDDTIADDGKISLREAIIAVNESAVAGTITFSPSVFNPNAISLTSALPTITAPVTITGSSATNVTVNGSGIVRVFTIDPTTSGAAVNITGLTITGGSAVGGGGGIFNQDAALTIKNSIITANVESTVHPAAGGGGGIFLAAAAASLVVEGSIISNNQTSDDGGGIGVADNSSVTVRNSLITGNIGSSTGGGPGTFNGSSGGGIYFFNFGNLLVENSTISGNVANSLANAGGALYLYGATAKIVNSTISGNIAGGIGGGIAVISSSTVNILNTTVAFNVTSATGGGIAVNSGAGKLTLTSTIVGQNSGLSKFDIDALTVTANNSLISATAGIGTLTGANNKVNVSPNLNILGDNGGFSLPDSTKIPTHLPGPGSPARNGGSNPDALTTDQRGVGFARQLGTAVDIGSVESSDPTPTASGSTPNIVVGGGTNYTFTVTYTDEQTNINLATIGTTDVTVTGIGFVTPASPVSAVPGPGGKSVTVTYVVNAPGGSWDVTDNGDYTVTVNPGEVFDTDVPTPLAVETGPVGVFTVDIPLVFEVTNDADNGPGSLRQAILDANAAGSNDLITFNAAFFSTPRTILLTTPLDPITDRVTIAGPGVNFVTVDGNNQFQIFNIDLVNAGGIVNISNMKLTKGFTSLDGGAILNSDAQLTLNNMFITGNSVGGRGGAIALVQSVASLTVIDSVLSSNTAAGDDTNTVAGGGAVFVDLQSDVLIIRSRISNNVASGPTIGSGGALFFDEGGTLQIVDSTLSGNTAAGATGTYGGGAIYMEGFTAATILNSTLSGNSAAADGGAILLQGFSGSLKVFNSTIAFNTAGGAGGGVGFVSGTLGTMAFTSTIVGKNAATNGPDLFGAGSTTNSLVSNTAGSALTGSPIVADPLLGALANNGGFVLPDGSTIQTHAITSLSPAFNQGSNTEGLTNDQRGTGFVRVAGGTADIGAFEVQATPSKVTSVDINNGQVQRSRVTSLKVNFDNPVTLANPNSAFTLTRDGGGSVTLNVVLDGSGLFATITFTGGEVDAPPGNQVVRSLVDGKYTLTAVAAQFGNGLDGGAGVGSNFVLNSTSYIGGVTPTPATGIFRLFGDNNGDGTVASDDFLAFRLAFLTANDAFDFDGVNNVDASVDFLQFRLNFLTSV